MDFSINSIKFSPVTFRANAASKTIRTNNVIAFDVFQKSVSEVKQTSLNPVWDENRISKIFDEVFEDVLNSCPEAKECAFVKPELSFEEESGVVASFNVISNKIKINRDFMQNQYMVSAKCNDGESRYPVEVMSLSAFQQNYASMIPQFQDIKTYKLNDDEKELYFRSVLAHELRHWVQENMLMSTKGCEAALEKNRTIAKGYVDSAKEYIELLQKENPEGSKEKIEECKKGIDDYSFILNYKPSKMLESDAKLKYSMRPSDKSYWSIKEHFLPCALNYKNNDETIYHSSPNEIDAYNYQNEYFILHRKDKKYKNISQDFVTNYGVMLIMLCNDDLDNMKKAGYPDLLR